MVGSMHSQFDALVFDTLFFASTFVANGEMNSLHTRQHNPVGRLSRLWKPSANLAAGRSVYFHRFGMNSCSMEIFGLYAFYGYSIVSIENEQH